MSKQKNCKTDIGSCVCIFKFKSASISHRECHRFILTADCILSYEEPDSKLVYIYISAVIYIRHTNLESGPSYLYRVTVKSEDKHSMSLYIAPGHKIM